MSCYYIYSTCENTSFSFQKRIASQPQKRPVKAETTGQLTLRIVRAQQVAVDSRLFYSYIVRFTTGETDNMKSRVQIGDIYGFWEVIGNGDRRDYGTILKPKYAYTVVCKCVCGNIREVLRTSLTRGISKSCGCKRRMTYAERYEKEFAHLKERDEQFNATQKHNLEIRK